jgi:hypothetical protein
MNLNIILEFFKNLRSHRVFGFAEREGFEPSIPFHTVHTLSRRAP